jgi:hypothetical protein
MTIINTDKFYVSEKPCPYGHFLRFSNSAQCVDCARKRDKERYAEKVAAQGRSVRFQSPKGQRKAPPKTPRKTHPKSIDPEALYGAVELLNPKEDAAVLLLRKIVIQADVGGPVFEMFHTVTRYQLADFNQRCKLPPLPIAPQRPTLSN